MSSGFAWRATLVTIVSVLAGFLAIRLVNGTGGERSTAGAGFTSRLSLIRQAQTGQLISLQIAPFEVGANHVRITLLNPVGETQVLESAQLAVSRLDSSDPPVETDSTPSSRSRAATFKLTSPGWWQIDIAPNGNPPVSFYLKLDEPSAAPDSFAPPAYNSDPSAQQLFAAALQGYERLSGLKDTNELTSGAAGPSGFGVWYLSSIDRNQQGFHDTTLGMGTGGSEQFRDTSQQCLRQAGQAWDCAPGASPVGPFDLGFMDSSTAFALGREEDVDGERCQVVFLYNPTQSAWYAWWVGEETHYLRRQAMVAQGHFMLDRFSAQDTPVSIQPKDVPAQ